MQFYDWKSGLILLALSGSLVLFTRFVFFVLHKRIFSVVEEYSFEVFFIIERMMFDISIQIISFIFLKWEFAVIEWFVLGVLLLITGKTNYASNRFLQKMYARKYRKLNGNKKGNAEILKEDVKNSKLFGVYISNPLYQLHWFIAHLCTFSFLLLPLLLNETFLKLPIGSENEIISRIYDFLIYLSVLSIIYTLGRIGDVIPIRVKGWRKIQLISYIPIAFFITLLFIMIQTDVIK